MSSRVQANKRRSRFVVGATVSAAAVVLAACGSETPETPDDDPAEGEVEESDPEEVEEDDEAEEGDPAPEDLETSADNPDELTVWHYFSEDNQVLLMDELAALFEEEHDVSVNNVFVPYDQLNSSVIAAAGAEEGPDVVVFNGAEWSTLALAGALAPLDEYWDGFEDADQFPDGVQHGLEDELFAVQGYVNLLGLWYNADLLDEVGVDPPSTIEELESAMAAAEDAGYRGITLSALPQSQGEWQAYPWLSSQGFDYGSPDEEALAAGFDMVRNWVDEGWLSQEAVNWDQTVPFSEWAAGDVAFAENGNWQQGAAESDADFEYGVVPLPVGDEGRVYLGGEGQGIGAFSQDPDLAWEYLRLSYYSYDGQLSAVENVGSIPSREDASQDDAVTDNELLEPFSTTLTESGANYPDPAVPPENVADLQTAVGQAWSAAVGGQVSPEEAAAQVMGQLDTMLSE